MFVWNREADATAIRLSLPEHAGADVEANVVFPSALPAWPTSWDSAAGALDIDLSGAGESARVIRIRRR